VSECRFVVDANCARCQDCGFSICNVKMPVHRICHAAPKPRPGLGDITASALAAVGLTKERVEAVVGGPCGCDERQAWLNAAGEKWLGIGNPSPTEAKDGQETSGVDR
jgi:hypothetical protein